MQAVCAECARACKRCAHTRTLVSGKAQRLPVFSFYLALAIDRALANKRKRLSHDMAGSDWESLWSFVWRSQHTARDGSGVRRLLRFKQKSSVDEICQKHRPNQASVLTPRETERRTLHHASFSLKKAIQRMARARRTARIVACVFFCRPDQCSLMVNQPLVGG